MAAFQWILLLGVVGICSYIWLLLQHFLERRLKRLPPGPIGLPVLGNILQIGSKPNKSLQRLSRKYGDLMCLSLGYKTVIVASSPAVARQIFTSLDKDLAGRDPPESVKILDSHQRSLIFAQPNKHWRMLRRISNTEIFSVRKLESLQHLRRSQISQLVHEIYEKSSSQRTCMEIGDMMMKWSLNLLGKTVFGPDMFSVDSPSFSEFKDVLHMFALCGSRPNLADFFPILRSLDSQHVVRDTKFFFQKLQGIFDQIIQRRCARTAGGENDVLQTLLNLTDSDFTLSDIQVYLTDLFLAGTDTTQITVEWALSELIKNPSLMKKAQAEIDEAIGRERLLEETDVERLPYLQAVVKETLRIHPAVPLLQHRAENTTEIGGFVIPKGAPVIINNWAIARDPSAWKEPCEFRPERFLEQNVDFRGRDFEFIPFGAGRRICVGMPLANVIIHSVLGALIQSFDWHGEEDLDMDYKFAVTMHRATPLLATPTPRLSSTVYG